MVFILHVFNVILMHISAQILDQSIVTAQNNLFLESLGL